MTPTVLVNCTHGREEPERATLSFVVGNVSATADQPTCVLLTCDGVWLGTHGYADDVAQPGMPPLRDVLSSFVDAGGEIWACGACTGPRGITDGDLVKGARIVTAAMVVAAMTSGARTLSF
ncbi:MAG TPA: DsrE family protein [Micromonosporaceae bacterium]|nr:DsrE family protein [Micromonosporaceae bacterium]